MFTGGWHGRAVLGAAMIRVRVDVGPVLAHAAEFSSIPTATDQSSGGRPGIAYV